MTKRKWTIKQLSLLIAIMLLSVATVGVTLAYIFTQTTAVVNKFTPAEVTCKINESMNGTEKKNVTVTNTGDTAAYIRAAVVVTWQNADGEVLGELPVAGTDYTIDFGNTGWKAVDGYYYYTSPVAANGDPTANLIDSCIVNKVAPVDGYKLHVEIIADAIQANPTDAVEEAWGVTVTVDDEGNATISKPAAEESN